MKKVESVITLLLIFVIILLFGVIWSKNQRGGPAQGNAEGQEGSKAVSSELSQVAAVDGSIKADKILIVYFSLTGNTHEVTNIMKDLTNGEVFEIKPDFDYFKVQSRKEMEDLTLKQVEEGFKPGLKNSVVDIDSYDLIIIGSPVWWYSVTPPVMSFLTQYDLAGKKVAPFCTCGSVAGDFFTQFEATIPDAEVQKGLTLTEGELTDEEGVKEKIRIWLEDLGVELSL